jgi:hypothetical protein
MADDADVLTKPSPASSGTDLDSLLGIPKDVTQGLTDIKKGEFAEKSRVQSDMTRLLERDQQRAHQQFEATGIQPGEFQKWNAEAEHEKHSTDPIVAFGSLGSIFGMVASAFTHAPMENALNASAAAMNAIKAGDEAGYERAHTAWKENTDLAFKRHQLQQQSYQDAIQLLNTDMSVGTAKLQMLASKYGDAQTLFLLEHGMSKELIDLQEKRNDAAVRAVDASERITKFGLQKKFFEQAAEQIQQEQDPVKKAGTLLYNFEKIFNNKMDTPQKEVMGLWFKQHPNATAEEAAEFYRTKVERPLGGQQGADQEFMRRFREQNPDATDKEFSEAYDAFKRGQRPEQRKNADQEFISRFYEEHPNAPVEEFSKAFDEFKRGQKAPAGGGAMTTGKVNAQTLEAVKADVEKEHPDWSKGQVGLEAERRFKQAAASPVTGNQRLKEEAKIDQFDNALSAVDKIVDKVEKYSLSTGIAGKATRLGERLSNVVGSKQTDRVQLMRDIEYLKATAPQLLLDRTGRPLAAEAGHINDIVAGLSLGDTNANTLRAMREIKTLLGKMRDDNVKRLGGDWEAPAPKSGPSGSPAKATPWSRDPIEAHP